MIHEYNERFVARHLFGAQTRDTRGERVHVEVCKACLEGARTGQE